jgi:predicted ribosomally synthesized peptide with SipW-like signal peptide
MKKRLLITSIVMMLVVAVALSTATYAWFTSSATATANQVTLTAATNNAPSLGISWTDGNYANSINAASPEGGFAPAAPETLWTDTTTGENAHTQTISTVAFTTAMSGTAVAGDFKFNAAGETTLPYTWTDALSDGHTSFFLKNQSPANAITAVTMTATIAGEGAELIRVGVFKKGTTNYELLGVLANKVEYAYTAVDSGTFADNTEYYIKVLGKYVLARVGTSAQFEDNSCDYFVGQAYDATGAKTLYTREGTANTFTYEAKAVYGAIASGASVNAMPTVDCVSSINVGGLTAQGTMELVVLVWEDGVALGDAEQTRSATIQLNFNA